MYGVQVDVPVACTSASATTVKPVPLISAPYCPARAGTSSIATSSKGIAALLESTIVSVSRPLSCGVVESASRIWVALVKPSWPFAKFESVTLNCQLSAGTSIGPSSERPHGVAGSSQTIHQMWNKSLRAMLLYVQVRPPALPRSPADVHVRLYGGNVASSIGVSCESAQPTALTTAPGGVL